jgi:hypothetical protein
VHLNILGDRVIYVVTPTLMGSKGETQLHLQASTAQLKYSGNFTMDQVKD